MKLFALDENRFTPDFNDVLKIIILNSLGFFFLGFLIPIIARQDMNASGFQVSLLISLQVLGRTLSGIASGYFTDHLKNRSILILIGSFQLYFSDNSKDSFYDTQNYSEQFAEFAAQTKTEVINESSVDTMENLEDQNSEFSTDITQKEDLSSTSHKLSTQSQQPRMDAGSPSVEVTEYTTSMPFESTVVPPSLAALEPPLSEEETFSSKES